jgi:hypothetical protein
MVLVAGIVQWAIIGMVLGGIVTWFRWRTYHRNPPEQPSFPAI